MPGLEGIDAYWVKQFVWLFILPPNGLLSLAVVGAVIALIKPQSARFGALLSLCCLLSFYMLVTPAVSQRLMHWVERGAGAVLTRDATAALMKSGHPPGAIVILGGGLMADEREKPESIRPSLRAFARVAHGAHLARWSGLPVLVSGGAPVGVHKSEAAVLAQSLAYNFDIKARWLEQKSLDTADNARFSSAILRREGIRHVILVTEAFHMRRAKASFEAAGLAVTPAPTAFQSGDGFPLNTTWMPMGDSVARASLALHEITGRWWYQIRRWWLLLAPESS